jgi:hypothetical protein
MASGIGPGTQYRVAPLPLFLREFDRGADPCVDTQMYVTSQLAIAVPLGLIAFLTFCVLRTKWSHFYMSLWRGRGSHILRPRSGWLTCVCDPGGKLPNLGDGMFSWIPQLWKVTDDQVLEAAGLDAYVVQSP